MSHKTVLLHEAVEALSLDASDVVVDATFGNGGHAQKILQQLDSTGTYIGIDVDATALNPASLEPHEANVHLVEGNFCQLGETLRSLNVEKVDAVLADLGWRIEQFETGGKGLSFRQSEPLLMTFGDSSAYPFTARDIVNEWEEEILSNIFFGYAEERYANRIAKRIVEHRRITPIETTDDLVAVIKEAVPKSYLNKRIHPATKVFQALRIAVNDELGALEKFIKEAIRELEIGGRLAIITFHSIEDRMVKQTFRFYKEAGQASLVNKKPVVPTRDEMTANPRARSAKLRIIEKL
jgi:16S rRNA (cytosine1402-N4)-methyltransferase